ncbi:hypothetical protein GCM10023149_16430 [Mucilaginibacter gynuensis]|uniref:FAD-binding FR-type domain-containing protein n=1 Tax=Mucilaginibacter gynuensis TaxID=1302236 RepID=A0ABP8G6E3_9SPHI
MENSLLKQLRKKADLLLIPSLLRSGQVLAVRTWEPATFVEIDLHLPDMDMEWESIPYIKFKVDDFTFRDYTPSGWDADKRTCTVFIDTGHNGFGSKWAAGLQKGDVVNYLKTERTNHAPDPQKWSVGLGDLSGLGHLLALEQMSRSISHFTGSVLLNERQHLRSFRESLDSRLQPIECEDEVGDGSLLQWVVEQKFHPDQTVFYIVGNNRLVSKLKRSLKECGFSSSQIKVKGFWG